MILRTSGIFLALQKTLGKPILGLYGDIAYHGTSAHTSLYQST